jgi:hypothetical protein
MFRTLLTAALCLLMAGPAEAARKPKKPVEPESALSPALEKPVSALLQDISDLRAALLKVNYGRPNAAIRKVETIKAGMKESLNDLRQANAGEKEAAAKDAAVVAAAAALRGADLAAQGLQDGDRDQVKAGVELAGMAENDLVSLDAGGEEAALGGGGGGGSGGETYEIGPSLGMNLAYTTQKSSSNLNADVSASFPVTRAMDVGAGINLGLGLSESPGTSSGNMSYGLNAFTRYHFLEIFSKAPWIVPYVGAKFGLNFGYDWSYSGFNTSSTDSAGTSLGWQLGSLFFVNHKTALTLQLESSSGSSTSTPSGAGAKSSTSETSSLALSAGLRVMF